MIRHYMNSSTTNKGDLEEIAVDHPSETLPNR